MSILPLITFDYTGLGLSTGAATYNPLSLANDAKELIEALQPFDVVIGGWSIGGMAAQVMLTMSGQRARHAVLLGTTPPGPAVKSAEQLFYDTAPKPSWSAADELVLFFEPSHEPSRAAGTRSIERIAQRVNERSQPVPAAWAAEVLGSTPRTPPFPAEAVLNALKATRIPVLHIGGDHDIIFPVENWYALNAQLPTLQLLTFPKAGHGPHHQHPQACAEYIATSLSAIVDAARG